MVVLYILIKPFDVCLSSYSYGLLESLSEVCILIDTVQRVDPESQVAIDIQACEPIAV